MQRGIPTIIGLMVVAGALAVWAWSLGGTSTKAPEDGGTQMATTSQPQSDHLRVMTVNVRINEPSDGINAWPNRRALLVKTLLKYNPDIMGCQEVTPAQGAYLIKELGAWYTHYPRPGVGTVEGSGESKTGQLLGAVTASFASLNTLFYRTDRFDQLDGEAGLVLPGELQTNASENTFATLAVLKEKGSERVLLVVDTHLRHQAEFATQCALKIRRNLAMVMKKYPGAQVLVMGDMNHDRFAAPYRAMAGVAGAADGMGVLADSFDYSQKKPGERWGNWHEFTGKPRYEWPSDLIFSSAGLAAEKTELVRDGGEHGIWPSDHFFVMTEFAWKRGARG